MPLLLSPCDQHSLTSHVAVAAEIPRGGGCSHSHCKVQCTYQVFLPSTEVMQAVIRVSQGGLKSVDGMTVVITVNKAVILRYMVYSTMYTSCYVPSSPDWSIVLNAFEKKK